jgi:capsular exopolysaccharide synthesis family protein
MSKVFDALARQETGEPPLGLGELLEELENAKVRLRGAPGGETAFRRGRAEPAATRTVRLNIAPGSPLLPFDDSRSEAAEQYRIARTRITQHPQRPSMIVVSSAGRGDGKTVTAVNLAGSLALKAEANVLLVDADFRHSKLESLLGLPVSTGLAQVLTDEKPLGEALLRIEQFPSLFFLTVGVAWSNPTELLDSVRWRELAEELRQSFRYIVVDSPPVGSLADYELIQAVADGTVLVLRPDHTNRARAAEVMESIPPESLIGVVMNWVPGFFGK